MFNGDVVSLELSVALIREVMGVDSLVDPGCLKLPSWEHNVVEHLVEDLGFTMSEVTLKLLFDVLKDGLYGVAVCVTCQKNCHRKRNICVYFEVERKQTLEIERVQPKLMHHNVAKLHLDEKY